MVLKNDYIKIRGDQIDKLKKIIDNCEKRDVNKSNSIIKEFQIIIKKAKSELEKIKKKRSQSKKQVISKMDMVWKNIIIKIKQFPGFIK